MVKSNYYFKILWLVISLFIINNQANASTPNCNTSIDANCNNSCIALSVDILTTIKAYAATLGVYGIIDANFNMTDIEGDRCNTPTNDIKFSYYNSLYSFTPDNSASSLDGTWYKGAWFRGINTADQVCVQVWLLAGGWVTMGCKYRPYTEPNYFNPGCYTAAACYNSANQYSKSFLPMTSVAMQCIKETVNNVFYNPNTCSESATGGNKLNKLVAFQNAMRKTVQAMLVLYVIFFGIKIALGQEVPKKADILMFITKMILVIYFSVGFPTNNKDAQYEDGLTTYLIPGLQSLSYSLADMVFSAGGSNGLCSYDQSNYPNNWGFLALWDSLDCRVGFYLGLSDPAKLTARGVGYIPLLGAILQAIVGWQIIFAMLSACFAIFLLSITVYFINTYVISLIAIAIVSYLGPLFVPMALFKVTKGYFDSWFKMLLSFAIQPVIITAFMALMLSVFDNLFYGTCTFTPQVNYIEYLDKNLTFFNINNSTDSSCTKSLGYMMRELQPGGSLLSKQNNIFGDNIVVVNANAWSLMGKNLFIMVICLFLFWHFAKMLSGFAADLTGGANLGSMAIDPNAVSKAAIKIGIALATSGAGAGAEGTSVADGSGAAGAGSGTAQGGTEVGRQGLSVSQANAGASSSSNGLSVSQSSSNSNLANQADSTSEAGSTTSDPSSSTSKSSSSTSDSSKQLNKAIENKVKKKLTESLDSDEEDK